MFVMIDDRDRQMGLTLVELLVAISIASVVSALLVMTWLSLSRSYSTTTRMSEAGELARDSVSRLSREIRDAEPNPVSGYPAVIDFSSTSIDFTTTFNQEDNDQPLPTPLLTRYVYELDEESGEQTLHRIRDTDGDGQLTSDDRDDLVVKNLRNYAKQNGVWTLTTEPFQYLKLDAETRSPVPVPEGTPPKYIALVQVHLLVQMPGNRPQPSDLTATIQLRNQVQ
jgi:prepilin-type N-terminal cleavage/methylation domain-containing protein